MPEYDFSTSMARRYTSAVDQIADRLDDLAAEVRRHAHAERNTGIDIDELSHVRAATRIVHAVTWGVANLQLDTLISDAQTADYAMRIEGIEHV